MRHTRRLLELLSPRRGIGRVASSVNGPHVQGPASVSRLLDAVVLALLPVMAIGMYNTGWQALEALRSTRHTTVPGWRGVVQAWAGADPGFPPSDIFDCVVTGALYVVPVLAGALIVGWVWQAVFATLRRRHQRTDGLLSSAVIFAMLLPPAVPLWQVAVGMSFGIVFGKEIFGGWGRNIVHPAVLGAAFVMLSFPDPSVGHLVWDRLGGFEGTPLFAQISVEGMGALERLHYSWSAVFLGLQPGLLGAGSAFAALLGGGILLAMGAASWRVMAGGCLGLIASVLLVNAFADPGSDPVFGMPWLWHMVLGGIAFGLILVATDPATTAMTNAGRWGVGLLVGVSVVLIRTFNPAHPDGVVFGLLLGSVAAPLIDYAVVWLNIRRREARDAR